MMTQPAPIRQVPLYFFNYSGGSYLSSILFELGYCVSWNRFEDCWTRDPGGGFLVHEGFRHSAGHYYPQIAAEMHHCFDPDVAFVCHHRLPTAAELSAPAVLLVRDPRGVFDSLRSRYGQGRAMSELLRLPLRNNGPSNPFVRSNRLYPAEAWAVYNSWVDEMFDPGCLAVVRFESLQSDPVRETRRVLDAVGVARDLEDIQAAVDCPTVARIRERGIEWRNETEHDGRLGTMSIRCMQRFGYEVEGADDVSGESGAARAEPDPIDLIAAEVLEGGGGDIEATTRDLMDRARAFAESGDAEEVPARTLGFGLALGAIRMVREAMSEDVRAPAALAHVLDLAGVLDLEPMHSVWAAESWTRAGFPEMARVLLAGCDGRSDLTFAEGLEIGREFLRVGDTDTALGIREEIARSLPAESARFQARVAGRPPLAEALHLLDRCEEGGLNPWVHGDRGLIETISEGLYLSGRELACEFWSGVSITGCERGGGTIDAMVISPHESVIIERPSVVMLADARKPGRIPSELNGLGEDVTVVCAVTQRILRSAGMPPGS